MPLAHPSSANAEPLLRRAMGRWDLTALGVNQVIGGAIFLVPAQIAAEIGNWSPFGFVLAGFLMLLIALCYAETGSRFNETGGAYLYTRAAFGGLIGFLIGWMQWFVRVSSQAAIVTGIASALAYYWRFANRGWGQILVISSITLLIGCWHSMGIRQSAWAINFFTIGKLAPLLIFITAGLAITDWHWLSSLPALSPKATINAGLLLVFAFGGFETVPVISGEAENPKRDLCFALSATILCVTLIMSLTQAVYVASSPGLRTSSTPLADSAQSMLGWAGAAVMGAGAIISMLGNNLGSSLGASRMLFAFAENGDMPAVFARIHVRYRTPLVAIWACTTVTLLLAVTGSFTLLANVSALARLVTYAGVSLATLALRNPRFPPAAFVLPLGGAIPIAATVVSVATIAGATGRQLAIGALALVAGAMFYGWNARMSDPKAQVKARSV